MELSELQNLWMENSRKLDENLRINRLIINQLMRAKPEKRLLHIKAEALISLILPIIFLFLILSGVWDPEIMFKYDLQFYIGASLFGVFYTIIYILSAKYYWLLYKIDFTKSILEIKTNIVRAEAYKIKHTRLKYLSMPFAITAILMVLGVPIFSFKGISIQSMIPLFLIVLVYIGSLFVTFRFTLVERFRKLNREISELEKLMNDAD